jgi:hypothetical protein
MARLVVASREYKVMLLPERFAGDEGQARLAIDRFWSEVGRVLAPLDIPTEGSFEEVKAHRRIRYFDTVESGFNGQRYIFRERIDVDTGEREVTLKYRHPDRYVAQDRDMDAKVERDVETKFEEDVKPPFVSVFSFSTTVGVDPDKQIARVEQVLDLFPGLARELRAMDDEAELSVVHEFCARELVLVGANLLLGKRDIDAECAMVIWHDDDDVSTSPVCVEFSFKYGDDQEDYRGTVTRDAHDVLRALHTGLPEWAHPDPKTKTAFVYG